MNRAQAIQLIKVVQTSAANILHHAKRRPERPAFVVFQRSMHDRLEIGVLHAISIRTNTVNPKMCLADNR